ncbi:MAG TPA: LytTR family DNA-binding domain-containing protein [Thermoanaerobaculia bacterium]|nr:LytTR family DNA-binding domain-containing protein [Thermoanaerobaculia bacterium]
MKIAIVEDEAVVARRLARMVHDIVGEQGSIKVATSVPDAVELIQATPFDLLFLDLRLHGKDGFQLLEQAVALPSQTIVVSGHDEEAVRAFDYGVADFVAKPWNEARLRRAIGRATGGDLSTHRRAQRLVIRKAGELQTVDVADLLFVRGADDYSELHLADGSVHLHEKSLTALARMLPVRFERVHRSFIVDLTRAKAFRTVSERPFLVLHDDAGDETLVPVARSYRTAEAAGGLRSRLPGASDFARWCTTYSDDLRKGTADRAGVKVDLTACEHLGKSGAVAAKQFSAAKHALADILVWQRRDDLHGIFEGGVPTTGQIGCVRRRPVERKRGDLDRRIPR